MEITLPTLDEIEAWWATHPDEWARTKEPEECVLAMPLTDILRPALRPEQYVSVIPKRDDQEHSPIVGLRGSFGVEEEAIPLPSDLNALGVAFDTLPGRPEDHEDTESDDDRRDIRGEDCLAFIRAFRHERGI